MKNVATLELDRRVARLGLPRWSLHLSERKLLLWSADLACWTVPLAGYGVVHRLTGGLALGLAGGAVSWWILAWVNGGYDVEIAAKPSSIVPSLTKTVVGVLFLLVAFAFMFSRGLVGRHEWAGSVVLALSLVLVWRMAYLNIFTLPLFSRRLLFAGMEPISTELANSIRNAWDSQLAVVGFLSSGAAAPGQPAPIGDLAEAIPVARANGVSEIVASPAVIGDPASVGHLVDCTCAGFKVTPSLLLYEELLKRVPVTYVDPRWIIELAGGAFADRTYIGMKRLADVLLGLIGLLGLALVFPFASAAIILESGFPVLYLQDRVGLRGKRFRVIKFRTMWQDAEAGSGPAWAKPHDDRITHVGTFLRSSRLDELPQAVNVLRGDMSLVGPRPERPDFVADLARQIPFYNTRHAVKPGLSGWAQINYGYGASVDDARVKLEYDLFYVRHQSLLLDALVVLRTIGTVLRLRGQ